MSQDMQVAALYRYGSPDVIQPERRPVPEPGPGELRIAITACAINPADLKHRRGIYRPFTGWLRPRVTVSGFEIAGTVTALGSGCDRVAVGQRVMALIDVRKGGGYAEAICLPQELVAPVPDHLSLQHAAAMPLSALSAGQAVDEKLNLGPGARLLINGACGGIGTLALQMAKLRGWHVTAVGHRQNLEFLRELGADAVIDYTKEDFTKRRQDWDAVLDVSGGSSFRAARRVLAPGGSYVTVQPTIGTLADLPAARINDRHWKMVSVFPDPAHIPRLQRLLERYPVRPVLDRTFPLQAAAEIHRYYESNVTRGRLLMLVRPA